MAGYLAFFEIFPAKEAGYKVLSLPDCGKSYNPQIWAEQWSVACGTERERES